MRETADRHNARHPLVSCPINTLLDPPANFRAGQGAPTRGYLKGTGEEAQRRPARKGAAQRVRYLWDRTLALLRLTSVHLVGEAHLVHCGNHRGRIGRLLKYCRLRIVA